MAGQDLQQWHVSEPYLETHCSLGEGPYYEPATNTLRFVDIIQKRLHTVSLTDGPSSLKTLQFDESVTVTADIEGRDPQEVLLIGAKQGLAVLDRKTGKYEYVSKFGDDKAERIRSNDGVVDPNGRFWLGTMTDFGQGPFQPEGSLYHFTAGAPATRTLTDLTIPNSVGFSPSGRTMYFTHSTAREVLAWDYDPSTGQQSNQRVFYRHEGPGEPDGFRVDTEGNLWHAVYGEWRVLKLSPEGKLIGEVRIPTRNATCCELVGGGELVITTAADSDSDNKESRRLGGAVFRVNVGAEGTPRFAYKM
ncbi:hypothetical protein C7999DRAFT_36822 [Corynascus novoguineensis]|uniref:SMP-30/Gluconolactonase/LRE-like region domain-containing protein n=1 Tax=Corynascus novoguineensis TaxID=1126955 RepID=A0AAN7HJ95_9PEZI|nr:hypothetical protein C7999DRAFT_36822 [Corynascus novoguineensis]